MRISYSTIWSLLLTNVYWHSDAWAVTVTSQPIRLSTNFMTLIPNLTFTEWRVVPINHLQRVWHARRERLPFWTLGSVPRFWVLSILQLLRPVFPNLPCLFSLFHIDYPSVFSRFFSILTLKEVLHLHLETTYILRLVRTYWDYRVLGTCTAAIFL